MRRLAARGAMPGRARMRLIIRGSRLGTYVYINPHGHVRPKGMRLTSTSGSGICRSIHLSIYLSGLTLIYLEGEVLVDDEQIGGKRRHARASRDAAKKQKVGLTTG